MGDPHAVQGGSNGTSSQQDHAVRCRMVGFLVRSVIFFDQRRFRAAYGGSRKALGGALSDGS